MNPRAAELTPSADWLGLSDRVCVVTGAGGGIGSEVGAQLLNAGARVAMLDRDVTRLHEVMQNLPHDPSCAMAIPCDVTRPADLNQAANQVVHAWGNVDLLVNNAGALYADALIDIPLDKWDQLLAVNLTGYLACAQVFGRHMKSRNRGSMVHIASISATVPQPYSGAYSVSKAGVKMLSQLLAAELGEFGVRSNVVSPAMVRTPMSEGIYADPAVQEHRERIVPARRISTPADIAGAVLFLASDRSSYISGQELLVDGGLTQAWMTLIPRPGFEKSDPPRSGVA